MVSKRFCLLLLQTATLLDLFLEPTLKPLALQLKLGSDELIRLLQKYGVDLGATGSILSFLNATRLCI
jgi:hypothetical protein